MNISHSKIPAPLRPRWETPNPPGVAGTYGDAVIAWALANLGITFDRWQAYVLRKMLRHRADGTLIHRTALFSTARQNGKSVIVRAFYGWLLDGGRLLHPFREWRDIRAAAHDGKQARIIYRAVYDDLARIPRLTRKQSVAHGYSRTEHPPVAISRWLGIETDTMRFDTLTGQAGSARGLSIGALAFDEVLTQRDFVMLEAVKPTQMAQVSPLLILTSTAGDESSVVLRQYYDRLIRQASGDEKPDPTFYGAWWAADDEGAGLKWPQIRRANPSPRIDKAAIAEEYRVFPKASWQRERLNLFVDTAIPGAFNPGVWAANREPDPLKGLDGPFALGVDIQPGWERASIVAAGIRPDGRVGIAVYRDIRGSDARSIAALDLVALLESFPDPIMEIGYDSVSGAAPAFMRAAENSGHTWKGYKPHEVVAASMDVTELIQGGRIAADDPLIDSQIGLVARRQVGMEGAFRFSRAASGGPIDAVMAMTFAAHGVLAVGKVPAIY